MTIHADNSSRMGETAPLFAFPQLHGLNSGQLSSIKKGAEVLDVPAESLKAFEGFIACLSDLVEIEAFGVQDVWDPAIDVWITTAESARIEAIGQAKRVIQRTSGASEEAWFAKACTAFVTLMTTSEAAEYENQVRFLRARPWHHDIWALPCFFASALEAFSTTMEALFRCPDYSNDDPILKPNGNNGLDPSI